MFTSPSDQAHYAIVEDLGNLEIVEAKYRHQTFSRHVHEGYCIGVIESGAQHFFAHGKKNTAPRDSVILVNADQVHDGSCATDFGWSYKAIYPVPEIFKTVCEDSYGNSDCLPWFSSAVTKDPLLAIHIRNLFQTLNHSQNPLTRETALHDVLRLLISRHARTKPLPRKNPRNSRHVRLVGEYLRENLSENITLRQLSLLTDLNGSYLTRLFKSYTGLPPHAWQNQQRLQKAKQLMRSGQSLAQIAAHCGFTDQSHLSRHFKRAYGATPGEYTVCYSRSPQLLPTLNLM